MKKIENVCSFLLIFILLFFVLETIGWCSKNPSEKEPHRVPAVSSRVKIDGILNEEVWQEALVLELKYEVSPGENIEAPVKTEVLLAYGSKHLYVGFRAYDPDPAKIRAHVSDRDNTWNDDYVGIVLDTFNDSRRAYYLVCNPYGIQADYVISLVGGGENWDGIWNSAGKITDQGYNVEMSIPYSTLRFQKKKEAQVWGIDAVRKYPRNLSHVIGLFPRDRSNNCYLCQAEKAIGFKGANPGTNLEFIPTVSTVLGQERESFPGGKFVETTSDIDPGLTARWSFTPNLTLNAAINPDFSQVEADAAQLDINTQFALYYPEKRPFFLEGASIFSSRLKIIDTRAAADPDWGIKLTGKEGPHAIGFFSARDAIANFIIPGSQGSDEFSLDMKTMTSALRYRWDLGKSSNLGILVTDREGEDYYNRLLGLDGDLRFTKKDHINVMFIGTQTRYPQQVVDQYNQPEGKFSGTGLDLLYFHETRNVFWYAHHRNISRDFRADVGFITQADVVMFDAGARYTWLRNPGHWYTTIFFETGYIHKMDHDENLLDKNFYGWFVYAGPMHSEVSIELALGKRTYLGRLFNENKVMFSAQARPSGPLYTGLWGTVGDRIDYYNAQPGKLLTLNPVIQYNVGRRLYFGLDHVFERLNVEGGRLYTANLSNIRLSYQFSRRVFLRVILQYADYKYNTPLYPFPIVPEYRHLFSQVLFSYKINPRTVLFLGYSDDYYGLHEIPLTQNNRTLFLKIGYALVL